MDYVQKWVNTTAVPLEINENTEVVYSNVDEPITVNPKTSVQNFIIINIPANIDMTLDGHENIDNDSIIINKTNNTHTCNNNNINIMEVEIPEENIINYDNTQIGESAYKKVSKGNEQKINSELRVNGKSYKTRKGRTVREKCVKLNPCNPQCQNSCSLITDNTRQDIVNAYYELNIQQRKDFLSALVKTEPIKRRYSNSTNIKKKLFKFIFFTN